MNYRYLWAYWENRFKDIEPDAIEFLRDKRVGFKKDGKSFILQYYYILSDSDLIEISLKCPNIAQCLKTVSEQEIQETIRHAV